MLGIVIANWNGEKLLDNCLLSLKNQEFKNFKIFLIDNNSTDKSIEIINHYSEDIFLNIDLTILDYNSGFAKASNIGIKRAIKEGCDYILTLNNDIEMAEKSLQIAMEKISVLNDNVYQLLMINYFDRNKCDAAGIYFDNRLIPTQVGFNEHINNILKGENEIKINGVCAGAAIYSAKALERVKLDDDNYFDSNFFAYFEDVDLSLRLRDAGFKFKLLKDSIVYHMHSASSKKTNGLKEYYLIRNLFIYTKRNQTYNELKKNNYFYYIRFIKTIVKNFNNITIVKYTIKGLIDGLKERKKVRPK